MRQIVVSPGEDGCWVVECPSLPGCVSQGQTKQNAIANTEEAVAGDVAALEEDGLPVPDFRPGRTPNPPYQGAFAGLETPRARGRPVELKGRKVSERAFDHLVSQPLL